MVKGEVVLVVLMIPLFAAINLGSNCYVVGYVSVRFDEIESKMTTFLKSSGYNVKKGKMTAYSDCIGKSASHLLLLFLYSDLLLFVWVKH